MLEEPRDWLARALLPLDPLPPKAPLLPELGTRWLPTRSPPPEPPRLEFMLPALGLLPRLPASRLPALGLLPRLAVSRVPALGLLPRLPPAGCWRAWFWRALFWRDCMESPRAVPPYLLAVPLSP